MENFQLTTGKEIYDGYKAIVKSNEQLLYMAQFVTKRQCTTYAQTVLKHKFVGTGDKELLSRTKDVLQFFPDYKVLTFCVSLPDIVGTMSISAFNCIDALAARGYGFRYEREWSEEMVSRDNVEPNVSKGQAVVFFDASGKHFAVPIVNRFINTNFVPAIEGVTFVKFVPALATSVTAVCSYGNIKRSVPIAVTIPPKVNELMGLGKMVKPAGVLACLSFLVGEMKEAEGLRGADREINLSGGNLAHESYVVLLSSLSRKRHETLKAWIELVNAAIMSDAREGFFTAVVENGAFKFNINYVGFRLPVAMDGAPIYLKRQGNNASFLQAHSALGISRAVRGEGISEKCVGSRTANLPFMAPFSTNEVIRAATDLGQFLKDATKIVVKATLPGAVAACTEVMNACLLLEYKGQLFVPSNLSAVAGVQAVAGDSPEVKKFTYRRGFYDLRFYLSDALKDQISSDVLLIDLDPLTPDGTTFISHNDKYFHAAGPRFKILDSFGCRYVLPTKMYSKIDSHLLDVKNEKVVPVRWVFSGSQISNLIVYVTNFPVEAVQDYDLNSSVSRNEWYAASILINLARCTYSITGYPPNRLLFSCGYPIVKVKVSGLGALGVTIVEHNVFDPVDYERWTTDDLILELERSTDVAVKAGVSEILESRRESSVVHGEGSSSQGGPSFSTAKEKDFDDPSLYVGAF